MLAAGDGGGGSQGLLVPLLNAVTLAALLFLLFTLIASLCLFSWPAAEDGNKHWLVRTGRAQVLTLSLLQVVLLFVEKQICLFKKKKIHVCV